ncbi:hypothetical protein TNCT_324071 [Trichonephila clavata]|uniref:Uncharacterized protein n=1 Tax=Trichonephila clavata TaxID=2740835 RepID=A0A8X6G4I7_TRICU|nr:hypothetical protein TNCT_324071 [Trichonephila clavata]
MDSLKEHLSWDGKWVKGNSGFRIRPFRGYRFPQFFGIVDSSLHASLAYNNCIPSSVYRLCLCAKLSSVIQGDLDNYVVVYPVKNNKIGGNVLL